MTGRAGLGQYLAPAPLRIHPAPEVALLSLISPSRFPLCSVTRLASGVEVMFCFMSDSSLSRYSVQDDLYNNIVSVSVCEHLTWSMARF